MTIFKIDTRVQVTIDNGIKKEGFIYRIRFCPSPGLPLWEIEVSAYNRIVSLNVETNRRVDTDYIDSMLEGIAIGRSKLRQWSEKMPNVKDFEPGGCEFIKGEV